MNEPVGQRPPTIYDVARAAGVSHQTVSRVIKGHRVSEASRATVQKTIEALRFRPNSAARSLATRRTNRIGALVYEMTQLGPMTILESAAAAARRAGYVLDIVSFDPFDESSTAEAIRLIDQHDLAGILALTPNDSMRQRLEDTHFQVPIYFETQHGSDSTENAASLNYQVGLLAADHLLDLGHTAIAHIAGPADWPAARLRSRGFRDQLSRHGVQICVTEEGNWSTRSGYEAARNILKSRPRPTVIFAANDQMAIGAISALTRADLRVPADVSVMGVDDIQEAAFTVPPLTTIPMHFTEQGEFALQALLAQIRGEDPPAPLPIEITSVLGRASTAPPPPA